MMVEYMCKRHGRTWAEEGQTSCRGLVLKVYGFAFCGFPLRLARDDDPRHPIVTAVVDR